MRSLPDSFVSPEPPTNVKPVREDEDRREEWRESKGLWSSSRYSSELGHSRVSISLESEPEGAGEVGKWENKQVKEVGRGNTKHMVPHSS